MKKEHLPLILDGLLTEFLPARNSEEKFSFRVPDRINQLTKTLNAYVSISYGLKQYFDQFSEGEDVPVEKVLLGTKVKDSEHPMYGPTKLTEIANAILKRIEEKGLSTQRKPEDSQKLARINAVLEFMVNKEEMSEPMADNLIEDFSRHFYSPEGVIKLRENGLQAESLSAAYADDNSAASREIHSIRAQEKIYKRIGELAKINPNNVTAGISSIQFNAPAVKASLKSLPGFEFDLAKKISDSLDLSGNLEKIASFASRGRVEFEAFPNNEVQRVVLGLTPAWFHNDEQQSRVRSIQKELLESMKKNNQDSSTKHKALTHCQKMFALVDQLLVKRSHDPYSELTK